jgi:hypothetical protein
MKHYYDHDGVTIFWGDCREILPSLSADIVITDPPWIAGNGSIEIRGKGVAPSKRKSTSIRYGAIGQFDPDVIRMCQKTATHDCLFMCGYHELGQVIGACNPLRGVFGWHKPNRAPTLVFPAKLDLSFIVWTGKASFLYGYQHWPSMIFSVSTPQAGCMARERFVDRTGKAIHPAQGPIKLYEDLLRPFPAGITIIDPYIGTGTSLVAGHNLGLKVIGIEIEERYCEIAARRFEQGKFNFAGPIEITR